MPRRRDERIQRDYRAIAIWFNRSTRVNNKDTLNPFHCRNERPLSAQFGNPLASTNYKGRVNYGVGQLVLDLSVIPDLYFHIAQTAKNNIITCKLTV